jgi:hypothetical protein
MSLGNSNAKTFVRESEPRKIIELGLHESVHIIALLLLLENWFTGHNLFFF